MRLQRFPNPLGEFFDFRGRKSTGEGMSDKKKRKGRAKGREGREQ